MPADLPVIWSIAWIAIIYFSYKLCLKRQPWIGKRTDIPDLPLVKICIQIPIYNEPHHAVNCLRSCAQLDWDRSNLEIQILDDSIDQTSTLVADEIRRIIADQPDLRVRHLQRLNRTGYKAGALNAGLQQTSATFIAIFDCDFRPAPNFLKKLLPHISQQPDVACAQARWSFTNEQQNVLTRMQAVFLNIHFRIEHLGRSKRGWTFNFNGTAGIWRRQALNDLGGWSQLSIAEDLLLSYKAQLAGWRLVYTDEVDCPSELPATWASFLIQQRRWAKGNGQVIRLLWRQIVVADNWSQRRRLDCLIHLTGYGAATLISLTYLFTPHWIRVKAEWLNISIYSEPSRIFDAFTYVVLLSVIVLLFSNRTVQIGRSLVPRIATTTLLLLIAPLFVLLVAPSYWRGITQTNEQGLVFHRTPKAPGTGSLPVREKLMITGLFALATVSTVTAWQHNQHTTAAILVIQQLVWASALGVSGKSPDHCSQSLK